MSRPLHGTAVVLLLVVPRMGTQGAPLPPGWEQHVDESSGDTYYWNRITDENSWDRPGLDVAAATAAAAATPASNTADAQQPRAMKSFLDPNMAAGFPRGMRKQDTRNSDQQAAAAQVSDTIKQVESSVTDMSSLEEPDDDLYAEPEGGHDGGDNEDDRVEDEGREGVGEDLDPEPEQADRLLESAGKVDRSLTYQELIAMRQEGKLPPGIKRVDDKPRGQARRTNCTNVLSSWSRGTSCLMSVVDVEFRADFFGVATAEAWLFALEHGDRAQTMGEEGAGAV